MEFLPSYLVLTAKHQLLPPFFSKGRRCLSTWLMKVRRQLIKDRAIEGRDLMRTYRIASKAWGVNGDCLRGSSNPNCKYAQVGWNDERLAVRTVRGQCGRLKTNVRVPLSTPYGFVRASGYLNQLEKWHLKLEYEHQMTPEVALYL